MDIRLKVSTEVMKGKAGSIQDSVTQVKSLWGQLSDIVRSSTAYWEGNSSDRHQLYLNIVRDDAELILRRMNEHPSDLLKMAGIYEDTEAAVTELISPLKSDVID